MNIFVLDEDPALAAHYMCDQHVVKMVLETAQLLSTCHRLVEPIEPGGVLDLNLYKTTHANHPCSVWLRESQENYNWLYLHFVALSDEYTFRFKKYHRAFHDNGRGLLLYQAPKNLPNIGLTPFAIAMKQHPKCIVPGDAVQSYRNYYCMVKSNFARWRKTRRPPNWYNEYPAPNHLVTK